MSSSLVTSNGLRFKGVSIRKTQEASYSTFIKYIFFLLIRFLNDSDFICNLSHSEIIYGTSVNDQSFRDNSRAV